MRLQGRTAIVTGGGGTMGSAIALQLAQEGYDIVLTDVRESAAHEAAERVTPSELYLLAREVGSKRNAESSCVLAELKRMATASPAEINYSAISRAFGFWWRRRLPAGVHLKCFTAFVT